MPTYSFTCTNCRESFAIQCSMKEIGGMKPKCIYCVSNHTVRDYQSDNVLIVDAIKTIGSIAERNADKFSQAEKQAITHKHNSYKTDHRKNPLPDGMSRVKRDEGGKYLPPPSPG